MYMYMWPKYMIQTVGIYKNSQNMYRLFNDCVLWDNVHMYIVDINS